MKAWHAIIRISLLLALNCLLLAFYTFLPDAKLHGWILTAIGVFFVFTDTSLALVLKGFDDIEADTSLSSGDFRKLRGALHKRRTLLKPMMPVNLALRVINLACGLILVNRAEAPGSYFIIVVGYLCASIGLQSCITLIVNLFDISAFRSEQRAHSRASNATAQLRSKLAKDLKGFAI